MRTWHPIRDKKARKLDERQRELGFMLPNTQNIIQLTLRELRRDPITIKHEMSRKMPPRPTRMCFVFYNGKGERWQTTPIDLTYKSAARVQLPNLAWMTGRNEDLTIPPMLAEVILEYDPQER